MKERNAMRPNRFMNKLVKFMKISCLGMKVMWLSNAAEVEAKEEASHFVCGDDLKLRLNIPIAILKLDFKTFSRTFRYEVEFWKQQSFDVLKVFRAKQNTFCLCYSYHKHSILLLCSFLEKLRNIFHRKTERMRLEIFNICVECRHNEWRWRRRRRSEEVGGKIEVNWR